jgi:hypothetical protein
MKPSGGDAEFDDWSSIEVLLHLPPWVLPERLDIPDEVGLDSFHPPSTPSASIPPNRERLNEVEDDDEGIPFWIPPPARGPSFEWPLVFRYRQRSLMPNLWSWSNKTTNPDKDVTPRLTQGITAELLKNIKTLLNVGNVGETLEGDHHESTREPNRFETQSLGSICACPIFVKD